MSTHKDTDGDVLYAPIREGCTIAFADGGHFSIIRQGRAVGFEIVEEGFLPPPPVKVYPKELEIAHIRYALAKLLKG